MSHSNLNRLSLSLLGAALLGVLTVQGCSSDEQATPASAGSSDRAGSAAGGKSGSPGSAGEPSSNGGAGTNGDAGTAGATPEENNDTAGSGGEAGGGDVPGEMCTVSFNNSTLTAITDNGGELPPLP